MVSYKNSKLKTSFWIMTIVVLSVQRRQQVQKLLALIWKLHNNSNKLWKNSISKMYYGQIRNFNHMNGIRSKLCMGFKLNHHQLVKVVTVTVPKAAKCSISRCSKVRLSRHLNRSQGVKVFQQLFTHNSSKMLNEKKFYTCKVHFRSYS